MERKIQVLIIDGDMNTVEIELNNTLFKQLRIDKEEIKQHSSKRALTMEVSDFLKKFSK